MVFLVFENMPIEREQLRILIRQNGKSKFTIYTFYLICITGKMKVSFFLGASSPLCWFNNKEFCVLHIQSNTTIFHLAVQ